MDQLKDILKQAVKYRFWIALGLSALLPLIGYFVGAGPIKKKAAEEEAKIKGSAEKVVKYTSPGIPNAQYKPIVDEKKGVLSQDVEKAWDKLYARQAPLLKWPERVEARFHAWGRKWPEDVDKGAVQQAISDYTFEYDKAVDETYKKVNPWDPIEGKGIVVVPDKVAFLRPAVFDAATPPELGKVWAAQERLWIQGTLLDAIAKINGKAKDWDGAVVKQINAMEVGSPLAQDQKSAAKGDTLAAAPSLSPGGDAAPAPAADAGGAGGYSSMAGATGSGALGGAGTAEEVYYLTANGVESQAYKILPVQMSVLVDQNRLQEFFIGLENSPMTIQVMEFEMMKPPFPVTKPVKGDASSMGMMGGMYGGSGAMYGGSGSGYGSGYGNMMKGGGMDSRGGMPSGAMYGGSGGGMYGGAGTASTAKAGIDNRSKDAKKQREEKEKQRKAMNRAVDMYYDIVQVTIYGQARFYNPPPPPPAADPSTSAAPGEEPKAADGAKPAGVVDPGKPAADPIPAAKPDEAKKADEPAAKPADGTPTPDAAATPAAKPADGAPKPDPTKPDAKPADGAPKAETPKAETPKAETPKAEAPKAEALKTDVKPADGAAPKR